MPAAGGMWNDITKRRLWLKWGSVFLQTPIRSCPCAEEPVRRSRISTGKNTESEKTEMTSSPFQRFSRKYSKEEISLEIVSKRRDSDTAYLKIKYQSCTVYGLNLTEGGSSWCINLPEWGGLDRDESRRNLPRGWGRADLKPSQSNTLRHARWKISTHV